jgi:hypothetical protein
MMVHNYYLYEEDGKLSIIPWDYNLGFGGFSAGSNATSTVNSPIDSPVTSGTTDSRPLIAWIFSDEEALAEYHAAYLEFINSITEDNWLENEIARVQEMITPYLEKDMSKFFTMDEFEKAVETLKTFCSKRAESVSGQLDGTIPSTSSGQRNSETLVDAGEISTSDMGSMGSGGGMGQPGGRNGGLGNMPDMSNMPDMGSFPGGNGSAPDMSSFQGGNGNAPDMSSMPDMSSFQGGNGSMPDMGSMPAMGSFPGGTAQDAEEPAAAVDAPAEETAEEGTSAAKTSASDTPQKPQERDGGFQGERPQGGPPGDMAGFGTPQKNQSEQWIQLAVCAALILAAILVIRRIRPHNQ